MKATKPRIYIDRHGHATPLLKRIMATLAARKLKDTEEDYNGHV